jgi:hypothetical protein
MLRRRIVSALGAALLISMPGGAARAAELRDPSHPELSITVPDTWSLSSDGSWALAAAPDRSAKLRVVWYGKGLLADLAAESLLVNFIADTWATYTVDRHIRHVTCGKLAGLDVMGHGAGDSWDRASFHLYLLVDPASPDRGAVVLISGKQDAWDAAHPPLDRAVHAIH